MKIQKKFMNKHSSTTKALSLLILPCICLLFIGFIFSGTAKAETDLPIAASAPTPNSGTDSGNAGFTPYTGVGHGKFNGEYTWYKVYVKNGQGAKIELDQKCDAKVGNPTVDYFMEDLSSVELDYGGSYGVHYAPNIISSGNCAQKIDFDIPANAGTPSTIKGHGQYRVFAVWASIQAGPGNAEGYFTASAATNSANVFIGMSKPDFTNKAALSYSTVYKTSGTWSFSVMFAPHCDVNPGRQIIKIKDADNGIYQSNMRATLDQSPSTGPLAWTNNVKTWTASDVQGGPIGQSNTVGSLDYVYDNNHIYKFHVLDSTFPNTIQIQLPFDQFDSTPVAQAACVTTPICLDPTATNYGGPLPCVPPQPVRDAKCNITVPGGGNIVRTTPGAAVNVPITITNLGNTTLVSPIKLYITGGATGSFDLPGAIPPGGTASMTNVFITTVPATAGDYGLYRTYRLGTSQADTFGGSCSPHLVVQNTLLHGNITNASCTVLRGHVWNNDSDNAPTIGRIHIVSNSDPTEPVDTVTRAFATWGSPYNGGVGGPDGDGGKFFSINPYNYNVTQPVGPFIDIQLDYHHVYSLSLQTQAIPGDESTWYDIAGPVQMEYPCVSSNISASCTSVSGNMYFKSTQPPGVTGRLVADGVGAVSFLASPTFNYDPFNSSVMGVALLPHVDHNFALQFVDFDNQWHWAVDDSGASPYFTNIGRPCLTFTACQPNPFTFEVPGPTQQTFTLGYENDTIDGFSPYHALLHPSDGTLLINGGGGAVDSTYGVQQPNPGPPRFDTLNWYNLQISGGIAPYTGHLIADVYYGGTEIAASQCDITANQVTKPYFKVFGSSASTGGAFNPTTDPDGIGACSSSPQTQGGVKAFAHFKTAPPDPNQPYNSDSLGAYLGGNQKYGASIEYSIESLGFIQGKNTVGQGFYSGDQHDAAGDFINTLDVGDQSALWGGNLGGTHCVKDYYNAYKTKDNQETPWTVTDSVDQMFADADTKTDSTGNPIHAEAFSASPSAGQALDLTNAASSLAAHPGGRVTLFVDGDVYVHSNIIYGDTGYNPANPAATTPPFFTLIAKGNIYVDPGVTELDGLYVAQGTNGFSTCGTYDGVSATNQPANQIGPYAGQQCNQKLTVNGSVVASQLKLLRIGGVGSTLSNANGDTGSTTFGKSNGSVEEFNYTPQMVESSPYYLGGSGLAGGNKVEKIFSLPPVY